MERTRQRIVVAARTLIARKRGAPVFSIDAVARQAKVARTTVYHQFGTRAALLEALFDHLAERGQVREGLARTFMQRDPHALLREFIHTFASFWDVDRTVMRRIQAMAVLDTGLEAGVRARHARRRASADAVIRWLRHNMDDGALVLDPSVSNELLVELLYALTSFETFNSLAGEGALVSVVPMVQQMVSCVFERCAVPSAPRSDRD